MYSWNFAKYLHGTWSLFNTLMIFGIKEKYKSLTNTMYLWLLLQIYPCYLRLGFVVQGHKSPDSFQKHERAEKQRSTDVFCRDRMKDKCAGMSLGRSVHGLPGRCSNLANKSSGIGIGEGRWEGQEWWGRSFHQSHTQINESGNREQRQRRCKDSEERDRRWRWNEKRKQDRNLSVNIWVFLGSLTWFEECSVKSLFYSCFSPWVKGWKIL